MSVSTSGVNRMVRELNKIEKGYVSYLRKELRSELNPDARSIAAQVNGDASQPIRGMRHDGKTKWAGVRSATVSFTPGRSRRSGTRLLSMKFTGGASSLGMDYAELAGIRRRPPRAYSKVYERQGLLTQHKVNGQGDAFIEKLQAVKPIKGVAGRYIFDAALKKRRGITGKAQRIIEKYASYVNVNLRAG